MSSPEEKLVAARCRLMSTQAWYGHMSLMMEWEEAKEQFSPMKTMYVTAKAGRIYCRWFREFVEERTVEELYGCIQHEIEHVLRLHLVRSTDFKADGIAWNFAADMCVNGRKKSPRVGYNHGRTIVLPLGKESEKALIWIPEDWPDDESAEYYYKRLLDDDKWKKLIDKVKDGSYVMYTLDDHAPWAHCDMAPDEVRQLVSDMVKDAANRSMGNVPGHVIQQLEKLNKPLVSWRELLKRYLGRHVGNRRKTYSRRARRRDSFGIPGVSHHAAARVSVIVDTSGSISEDDLSQFFGEMEAIVYRAKLCILQWDHAYQGFTPNYRKGQWRKFEIHGRGGTDMAAPVEWLIDHGCVGDVCVMLTDGYCNYTTPKPFPMITCICEENGSKPDWGHSIYMKGQSNFEENLHRAV